MECDSTAWDTTGMTAAAVSGFRFGLACVRDVLIKDLA